MLTKHCRLCTSTIADHNYNNLAFHVNTCNHEKWINGKFSL